MPKKFTRGTGITATQGISFDLTDPDELPAFVEYFDARIKQAADPYSGIEEFARSCLRKDGLPDDETKPYYWGRNPNWWRAAKGKSDRIFTRRFQARLRRRIPSFAGCGSIDYLLKARGYEDDSPQGYACRLLDRIGRVRQAIAADNAKDAARWADDIRRLWSDARMKSEWEKKALDGLKIQEGRVRGGKADKKAKGIFAAIQMLKAEDPTRTWEATWACIPEFSMGEITLSVDGIKYNVYRDGEVLVQSQVVPKGSERQLAKVSAKRHFYEA